jgi:L,D-peptidoglycan transpeptidase YkuD (ErfK/YbiS/YcfS/YnhG family)
MKTYRINQASHLIVVIVDNWQSVQGQLWFFEKNKYGSWVELKSRVPVVVGKKGSAWVDCSYQKLAKSSIKQEGDSKAPAGILKLGKSFGFAAEQSSAKYITLKTGIECIDDSNSKYYNQIINTRNPDLNKDWQSSEDMAEISLYKYGIEILYNSEKTQPGKGSCIFMHIWQSSVTGTQGCTAMPEDQIKEIQKLLKQAKDPILVQLPKDIYTKVQNNWGLPDLSLI